MKPWTIRRALRGVIYRLRYCTSLVRLVLGSIAQLKNWRKLLRGTLAEILGGTIVDTPILNFRRGLQIEMPAGGYAGFYILFAEIFIYRCYSPTPQFIVRSGWNVVDIGANVGFFTCQAATAASGVRVVAVEPVSAYIEVLRRNIQRNALRNVDVLPVAVSRESGREVGICVWYTPSGEAKTHHPIPSDARTKTEIVKGMTLADIFNAARVERCDLLKIDIEGAEYEFFEGIRSEDWARVERVVMETHEVGGRAQNELVRILKAQGFESRVRRNLLWATRSKSTGGLPFGGLGGANPSRAAVSGDAPGRPDLP